MLAHLERVLFAIAELLLRHATEAREDLVRDDFPKNGIRTAGQALAYLEDLQARIQNGAGR